VLSGSKVHCQAATAAGSAQRHVCLHALRLARRDSVYVYMLYAPQHRLWHLSRASSLSVQWLSLVCTRQRACSKHSSNPYDTMTRSSLTLYARSALCSTPSSGHRLAITALRRDNLKRLHTTWRAVWLL
jgi:hypothetical protein